MTQIKTIECIVCEHTGLDYQSIYGKSRKADCVFARRLICVFGVKYAGLKQIELARMFGLDHSTILHHLKNFDYDIAYDNNRRTLAKRIEDEIQKCSIS